MDSGWFPMIKKILHWAEIDRTVVFGILTKVWIMLSAPVTLLLIALYFTPQVQGYYYTFISMLALTIFVELGLSTVIIQFASHEWSKLSIDEAGQIIGDTDALSRLISLARTAVKWYLTGSIIVALGLGIVGYVFFSRKSDSSIGWVSPWLALCFLTAITLGLTPIWSLLEGCNQVVGVYTYRLIQGLFASISIWLAIYLGAGLWAASISSVTGLVCAGIFLRCRYWQFLRTLLLSQPTKQRIRWRLEVLPMQWRIALSWISGYVVFSMFTPVLFYYHGAVLAGQMGMTWSMVNILPLISSAWISPRVPRFGMLIARRKYEELDKIFWRLTIRVVVVAGLGATTIWGFVYILNALKLPLAGRILPLRPTGLLLVSAVIVTISVPFSVYMRAHKKEPLLLISVICAILVCASNLTLGKYFGATGMTGGFLLINLFIYPFILLIWHRCRMAWHVEPIVSEPEHFKDVETNMEKVLV
jgi:O-antigen/teichoic acid export membrane protein